MTWLVRLSGDHEPADMNGRLSAFASGDRRTCPICDGSCEALYCWHGIEYVVLYIRPCNCRLGCWESAPQWALQAGIVEHDREFLDDAMREPTCAELREDYPDQDWSDCVDIIDHEAQEADDARNS